jgi:hypothetical protein
MVLIKEFELYDLSLDGRIYSFKTKKYMALSIQKSGYVCVRLCQNYKKKTFRIHRLLATYFILNPENKKEINHIDGNKLNNSLNNLEWVTKSENQIHARKLGLIKKNFGVNHFASKKVLQMTKDNALVKMWDSVADAARFFNCNPDIINRVCRGERKTCKKYVWKYKQEWSVM